MAVAANYRLSLIQLPGPVYISQIENATINAGIQKMLAMGAGEVLPSFTATEKQEAMISFKTEQLATLLGACGMLGLAISGSPAYLYFRLASATGSVAIATTSHLRLAVNFGHLFWSQITLPHAGRGSADCELHAGYDGSNLPLVYTGAVAVPSQPLATEVFGAGPVVINAGTAIGSIQNATIKSGVSLEKLSGNSEIWPTWMGVNAAPASIDVECLDRQNWNSSNLGLSGVAISGSTIVYARKKSNKGMNVADATEEHISFLVNDGRVLPDSSQGDGARPVSDRFTIDAVTDDGTTSLVTIDTTAAIA